MASNLGHRALTLLLCLNLFFILKAQTLDTKFEEPDSTIAQDSIQISLLTCTPGPQVYALYGHMAIRYQNLLSGDDFVFNYGTFDMSAPFFIPKFVLGLMDYQLGGVPYEYFHRHYSGDGADIIAQVLNLTPEEEVKLMNLLLENYKPENREYRYNFLYDNCATRPRDILEKCVDGEIVYSQDTIQATYRMLLHEFNDRWPWSKLGVDLVLGAEADRLINARQKDFLPSYLMEHFNQAVILDGNGAKRPLVKSVNVDKATFPLDERPEFPLSPMACALIILSISLVVSFGEFLKKKIAYWYDLFIFLAQGFTGIILFILFFLSEHPCTGSNWLIILFNPIPLLFLPRIINRGKHLRKDLYHIIYGVILTLFIIFFGLIPQDIPLAVLPLALVLLFRHISHYLLCKK